MKVSLYLWSIRSRSEYVGGTGIREEYSVYRKVWRKKAMFPSLLDNSTDFLTELLSDNCVY